MRAFGCESNGNRSSNSTARPSYNRGSVSKNQIVTLGALAFFTKERTSYLRDLSGVNAMLCIFFSDKIYEIRI
jgi:hypothetical protein